MEQTTDRIIQAIDNIKRNTELYSQFEPDSANFTLAQLEQAFEVDFKAWRDAYDVEKGTGDIDATYTNFDKARSQINLMTETVRTLRTKKNL